MDKLPFLSLEHELGPNYDEIMRWALGENYDLIPFSMWDKLLNKRIGTNITPQHTLEQTFAKIKNQWIYINGENFKK